MLENANITVVIFIVLAAILSAVRNGFDLYRGNKRTPSIDKELRNILTEVNDNLRTYVLKVEHERDVAQIRTEQLEYVAELRKENDRQWTRINGESQTTTNNFKDLERSLGRIEGAINELKK